MSCIIASITRANSVAGHISRQAPIIAVANREPIEASIHRVCRVGLDEILVVSPEVVWLTPDNDFSADFYVTATGDWRVE